MTLLSRVHVSYAEALMLASKSSQPGSTSAYLIDMDHVWGGQLRSQLLRLHGLTFGPWLRLCPFFLSWGQWACFPQHQFLLFPMGIKLGVSEIQCVRTVHRLWAWIVGRDVTYRFSSATTGQALHQGSAGSSWCCSSCQVQTGLLVVAGECAPKPSIGPCRSGARVCVCVLQGVPGS